MVTFGLSNLRQRTISGDDLERYLIDKCSLEYHNEGRVASLSHLETAWKLGHVQVRNLVILQYPGNYISSVVKRQKDDTS